MNYLNYYNLEDYLFTEVTNAFHTRGYLTVEEFFSIVIWKANRAKTMIKAKLTKGRRDLDTAVKDLTTQIHQAASDEERLRIFLSKEWAFGLAMASAILTVFYPDRFTVYDVRVRGQLNIKDFAGRRNQIELYFKEYLPKVGVIPETKALRDKDATSGANPPTKTCNPFSENPKEPCPSTPNPPSISQINMHEHTRTVVDSGREDAAQG